ncbi:MAG TPA: TonB family protein [Gemmatimonadaceae bacterium]|nr:TonB family protein [Gemmatimonadaceae bacterium]
MLARTTTSAVLGPATLLFGAVSVASHVVLTWGMVTIAMPSYPDASNDPLVQSRFLYPLMQRRPRPVQEHISYVGMGGVQVESAPATKKVGTVTGATPEIAEAPAPPESVESEPFEAFTELEVDVAAERDPDSEGPAYPEDLLARKIEGEARVRFIIDSTGHAEEGSFGVIETNEAGFAEAVRQALPRMKFRPATIGNKRVPQHVQQSFIFKITPPAIP